MSKRLPPPRAAAPNPLDPTVAAIVKKKMAAPAGPPPQSLKDFKAPKNYGAWGGGGGQGNKYADDDDEDYEDGDYFDYSHIKHKPDQKSNHIEDSSDEDMSEDERERGRQDSYESEEEYRESNRRSAPPRPQNRQAEEKSQQRRAPPRSAKQRRDYDEDEDDDATDSGPGTPKSLAKSVDRRLEDAKATESPVGKLDTFKFNNILRATYRELKTFVTQPCDPGVVVRCYIERNRSGSNMLAPVYSLCADLENGTGREIMSCKKVFKSRSPHYVFSLKSEDLYMKREQRSKLFLGKLRGVGPKEYVLYDDGMYDAPDNAADEEEGDSDGENYVEAKRDFSQVPHYRKQIASILYNCKYV
jgi:hypothetical protein